ncbi:hypothetical protein Rhopal_007813-T1 [Rhodotorula paludigena]|uniref:SMP-30/Gluconolactonase/LRE-like region domain-containing protein n=1 Tax=Rhodotorula paludigena TaxID=86838 RepID=A0AAV5GZC7_9BASI|nr:hypothetical protein Rhopal_007813-T1 [Rhodotorula paludigena]
MLALTAAAALAALPALASPLAARELIQEANTTAPPPATAYTPDLDILNALPMPLDRIGTDNATLWNISLPDSPSYNYSGPSVEQARDELTRFSQATTVAYQAEFLEIAGNATVERVFSGGDFHEALVYIPEKHQLFFIPNLGTSQFLIDLNTSTLHNFTASPPVENANGATYHDGKLYISTNGGNETNSAVIAVDVQTNQSSIVIDNYYGLRFNAVNDIVADNAGNLYFTDASYGQLNGFNPRIPQVENSVYLYNATTKLVRSIIDGIQQPNGLVFSPDGSVLYVTDTGSSRGPVLPATVGPRTIYAFDVVPGPFFANRRVFWRNPSGVPDGIKVDTAGRVWSEFGGAEQSAIEVINPDGQLLGLIQLPGRATQLAFVPATEEGQGDDLWVTGEDSVYRITGLNVTGVRVV